MPRTLTTILALLFLLDARPVLARMQDASATTPDPAGSQDQTPTVSDRAVNPAQPDFTLIGLPTTLRIPRFASSFRVTHRFGRPLGQGDFGDLLYDFFGIDGSGQIGLEYRFGLMAGTQIGIHRTSNRDIQFFAQQQVFRQGEGMPVGIDVIATAEGTNNFRDQYSPAVGAVVSHTFGRHGAVYAHPIWINNTFTVPNAVADDNSTFIVGIGGRVRIRPTVYVVGEIAPRTGYTPDAMYASFAVEKRAGGHTFQVNFSNGTGTTLAQIARGGVSADTWFFGFNISRKFF